MGTDKVIFVREQWGATGSHMTRSDVTGSHVTGSRVCTCATGTFCITTRVVVQVPWLPKGVEGCAHAQPQVAQYP